MAKISETSKWENQWLLHWAKIWYNRAMNPNLVVDAAYLENRPIYVEFLKSFRKQLEKEIPNG